MCSDPWTTGAMSWCDALLLTACSSIAETVKDWSGTKTVSDRIVSHTRSKSADQRTISSYSSLVALVSIAVQSWGNNSLPWSATEDWGTLFFATTGVADYLPHLRSSPTVQAMDPNTIALEAKVGPHLGPSEGPVYSPRHCCHWTTSSSAKERSLRPSQSQSLLYHHCCWGHGHHLRRMVTPSSLGTLWSGFARGTARWGAHPGSNHIRWGFGRAATLEDAEPPALGSQWAFGAGTSSGWTYHPTTKYSVRLSHLAVPGDSSKRAHEVRRMCWDSGIPQSWYGITLMPFKHLELQRTGGCHGLPARGEALYGVGVLMYPQQKQN